MDDDNFEKDYKIRKNTALLFSCFSGGLAAIYQNELLKTSIQDKNRRRLFVFMTAVLSFSFTYLALRNIYEL